MQPFKGILFVTLLIFVRCTGDRADNQVSGDILWYDEPAVEWEEALPLGNGRLGVMVFGDPSVEHLQLNDDSLWPGDADDSWDEPGGNKEDLQMIRELLFEGKNELADSLLVEKFSRKQVLRSHQTLGDLHIELGHENISDYRRNLNMSDAIASVSYYSDGALIKERVFVSHPHQSILMEIITESPRGLNGKVLLSRPEDEGVPTVSLKTSDEGVLIMEGQVTQRGGVFNSMPRPLLEGVKFETRLMIENDGGEVVKGDDYLELRGVERAVFKVVSNSSFYSDDYSLQNRKDLAAISGMSFDEIMKNHIKDHQDLYSRVQIKLTNENLDSISTDKRLERVKNGETDLGLEALLFQYGRYLLIASSREGTNPANLQGLWNRHISAPWNADYHLNINLQMNYWLADVTNLSELNHPLFDYVDRLVENGKVTAQKNFGCRGSFMPHATDLWAPTWLRAATAYWGGSFGAAGWMMQHYWQHFEYTRDTTFLRTRAFPAIQEVAMFYSDWIIEDPRDGTLISAPSTSPENRYINAEGNPVATCLGSAMDQQIIAEVFDNYLAAAGMLGIRNSFTETIKEQRSRLRPGFVIGSDGRILEWDREYQEFEPGHRHMSHLYGFHPGTAVSAEKDPEIFEAVRNTLDYRLDNGGAGTGWSRAWLINCSARLLDGEMAHDHINLLFQKSIFINLFDAHPPFQIDGNFGFTAGIAEMLLQSHEKGTIRVLPALPSAWKNGYVKGLQARGGFTVDIYWKNSKLEKMDIKSRYDSDVNLVYNKNMIPVSLARGDVFNYKPE